MRLELLECGEKLGWPRMGTLRAGKINWQAIAGGPSRRFVPFLRAAKIRVENLHGEPEAELNRIVLYGDVLKGQAQEPKKASRYTPEMRRANLAKAREAKKARAAV